MTTQTRYRTLVSHLAKVYAAEESARTLALHDGLDEIVTKIQPDGATAWRQVKADSQRLLKVWMARESRPCDAELATQILDALDEFATDAAIVSAVAAVVVTPPEVEEVVTVVKVEPAPVTAKAPAPIKVEPAPVTAKAPSPAPVTAKAPSPAPAPIKVETPAKAAPAPVLVVQDKIQVVADEEIVEEEVEEEAEEEEIVEEEAEEEEVEETEETEEVEEEEEVVEAEEEETAEDEEEGMEVEKKIFRGRAYWLDVKTNKLYTVVGDEDVGDEVGKIVDGRPVFLAKV